MKKGIYFITLTHTDDKHVQTLTASPRYGTIVNINDLYFGLCKTPGKGYQATELTTGLLSTPTMYDKDNNPKKYMNEKLLIEKLKEFYDVIKKAYDTNKEYKNKDGSETYFNKCIELIKNEYLRTGIRCYYV